MFFVKLNLLPLERGTFGQNNLGPIKEYVTCLGRRGLEEKMTRCNIGGEGQHRGEESKPKSDVTPAKIYCIKNCILID